VLLVLVLAALGVGAYFAVHELRHHSGAAQAAAAPPRPHTPVAHTSPRPLQLLSTPRPPSFGTPRITAPSGILVDEDTGAVLWVKHPHAHRPIASTTKIMTATLVLEQLPLDRVVVVPREAAREPLVREGLRPHEHVAAWKLLDGLLIYSGNDDAYTLAAAVGGTRRHFVTLMNEKAHALGLHDTHFSSVSGVIDQGNYSSAWDLAALARYAMRDPRFRKVVDTRIAHVPWSAPTFSKVYINKNTLLGTYRGADGVKTGWTTLAGHCLVAAAHRNGRSLIAVVLHATDPDGDARRLLNFGFAQPGVA
jgi:D-alanyl-D-alanine carboxypeptidase